MAAAALMAAFRVLKHLPDKVGAEQLDSVTVLVTAALHHQDKAIFASLTPDIASEFPAGDLIASFDDGTASTSLRPGLSLSMMFFARRVRYHPHCPRPTSTLGQAPARHWLAAAAADRAAGNPADPHAKARAAFLVGQQAARKEEGQGWFSRHVLCHRL